MYKCSLELSHRAGIEMLFLHLQIPYFRLMHDYKFCKSWNYL